MQLGHRKTNLGRTTGILAITVFLAVISGACSQAKVASHKPVEPANVNESRITNADREPGNWMTYGRTYDEQRFSPLNQINDHNVSQLGSVSFAKELSRNDAVAIHSYVIFRHNQNMGRTTGRTESMRLSLPQNTELHRYWAWDCFPPCPYVSSVLEVSRSLIAGVVKTKEVLCIEAMGWEVCCALRI